MRHFENDPSRDDEAASPKDMRDTRPIWLRVAMVFQGWCMYSR
jgi:hypothetical protein